MQAGQNICASIYFQILFVFHREMHHLRTWMLQKEQQAYSAITKTGAFTGK